MPDAIPGPASLIQFPTPNARQGGTRVFSSSMTHTPYHQSTLSSQASLTSGHGTSSTSGGGTTFDPLLASMGEGSTNSGGHGVRNGDIYESLRIGTFPVPGNRPPYVPKGPLDPRFIERFAIDNSQHSADANVSAQSTSNAHPGSSSNGVAGVPVNVEEWDFETFLRSMPKAGEDSSRHTMFTELIKLRTKSLELQIAEARRKEKEASVELEKWKMASLSRIDETMKGNPGDMDVSGMGQLDFNPFEGVSADTQGQPTGMDFSTFATNPQVDQNQQGGMAMNTVGGVSGDNGGVVDAPTPMTLLDLESMMHDNNLDGLFSWLPDFGQQQAQQPQTTLSQPNPAITNTMMEPSPTPGQPPRQMSVSSLNGIDPSNLFANHFPTPFEGGYDMTTATPTITASLITSPLKRSASPMSETEATSPAQKRSKRTTEKKVVVEKHASCLGCQKSIAKIMFRAPRTQLPEETIIDLKCKECSGVSGSSVDSAPIGDGHIGTVEIRKRLRGTLELEDEEKKETVRRQFCDVCQRLVAAGRIIGGGKERLSSIAEIICASCDSKYQRCTDCGGGGGPRVGIGKWRMKQVFPPGRKTCSLSHNRLGDRPRELGVHVTPTDFNPSQLKEVLTRTRGLWNEKTLARLAVPEMLEIDLPPGILNPVQDYSDVEDIITRNWPTREAMICAEGVDGDRFKRLLGLIWAHPRSRRAVRTVDLEEEEYTKSAETENEVDMSTVLENVKRTNIVIPPGSELVGMWGGEWDMQHGALLITTLIPFEGADGEDNTALSVGEMITKVQSLQQTINQERTAQAQKEGKKPVLLPQCEHLWVVSGGTMPLVRERVADVLIKKRSFVHVEEYLTRHPEFAHALNARPLGLHPDLHKPVTRGRGGEEQVEEIEARPLILVRWLGRDFDSQKVREIKLQEFGGKAKMKKKLKGR